MDEYWSRVIDVYVVVAVSSGDALKRTIAHISAASATNTEILIPNLNFPLI